MSVCIYIQVIRAAMYEFKSLAPSIPALLLSVDHENDKFICIASVPEVSIFLYCNLSVSKPVLLV